MLIKIPIPMKAVTQFCQLGDSAAEKFDKIFLHTEEKANGGIHPFPADRVVSGYDGLNCGGNLIFKIVNLRNNFTS